ncbi:hypothetical protein Leryth_018911 [Lithospermum erythrorhizon]|nr:hypothetical protein Leryth_018911 [Lithospermum erythrorhizon]
MKSVDHEDDCGTGIKIKYVQKRCCKTFFDDRIEHVQRACKMAERIKFPRKMQLRYTTSMKERFQPDEVRPRRQEHS